MNKPEHLATDQPSPTSAVPPAPRPATAGALSVEGDPHNELSRGKNRFMTALLDKLNVDETQVCDSSSARPMTFTYPPGSTPLPRYTIRRGIGTGGFGEVYFAVSEAGKEVALKRIQRNLEVELRGVSHCLNLKHPNLVALYDVCRDDQDQWWVVMEYIAGPNLRQVLDQSPDGLPDAEVRRWFQAVATGVGHLHSAGLVHRDLKPGNVFDDLGLIKVGDYGLSKFISTSQRGGHTESVGTFHYMAPEIGRGRYGREIDIYALGIVLYELITGRVPFDGESCHEIIVKHLTATPDLSGIAGPYRQTIARCLEKDPAKRFATVHEMLQSLGMSSGSMTSGAATVVESETNDDEPVLDAKLVESEETDPPVEAALVSNQSAGGYHWGSRHRATADEPLARAVRHSLDDLKNWWATLDRSPGAKAFLMIVGAFVLIINTHWLLPLLSVVAFFYVPYYVVRQMVLHVRQQPTYAEAQRIATAAGVPGRPISRAQWRSYMRNDLRAKRSIHRVAELNTSWIASSLTAVGMALATGVIMLRGDTGPITAIDLAPFAWMGVVVLVASVGLLGMGKLWERDEGEGMPRRLVLAGVGAAVGVAAYALSEYLMLPHSVPPRDVDALQLPQALYDDSGHPLMAAMMAHFALLFATVRWWKAVDPLRRTRLSFWSVAVVVVVEYLIHQVLPIAQPQGMLMAGGIAIAVQMAAPWINPRALPSPQRQQTPTSDPTVATRSLA